MSCLAWLHLIMTVSVTVYAQEATTVSWRRASILEQWIVTNTPLLWSLDNVSFIIPTVTLKQGMCWTVGGRSKSLFLYYFGSSLELRHRLLVISEASECGTGLQADMRTYLTVACAQGGWRDDLVHQIRPVADRGRRERGQILFPPPETICWVCHWPQTTL